MKIEFLTQNDTLYVLPFFEEFVRNYSKEFEILHISAAPTMGRRSRTQLAEELWQLYGTGGFARLATRAGLARLLGALPKASGASRYYTLAQLSRSYGIQYAKIGNPNAKAFVESVRQRRPDLLISVACPFILKAELLGISPFGAINIHHAPLPSYKGMMPTFWQMYHGEKSVGLTIHYMDTKVDEGAALLQAELPIDKDETLDHLIERSKRHGAHCMAEVVRQIATRTQQPLELANNRASYFTFPTREEIREFHRRGLRAI